MRNESLAIKNLRKNLGLTQRDLAAALGYTTPQFVSNVERGLCSLPIEAIRKITRIYGVKKAKSLANAKIKDFKNEVLERLK